MGKDFKSLKESRKIREELIKKYGWEKGVPTSILKYDASDLAEDLATQGIQLEEFIKSLEESIPEQKLPSILKYDRSDLAIDLSKKGRQQKDLHPRLKGVHKKLFGMSGRGSRNKGSSATANKKGTISLFPQNVGRQLVLHYTQPGDIVYDPFAGHNSRMQLVYEQERNYIGVDVSKEFMEDNRQIREILYREGRRGFLQNTASIILIEGSSSDVDIADEYADFTITSPPYWDLEYYGDEPEQLGNNKTYEGFLETISKHVKENFRILRSGAYCCWFVGDFVKKGQYYDYHVDLAQLFIEACFELSYTHIIDLGSAYESIFVQSIVRHKRFPKQHEYCLVFKKP